MNKETVIGFLKHYFSYPINIVNLTENIVFISADPIGPYQIGQFLESACQGLEYYIHAECVELRFE